MKEIPGGGDTFFTDKIDKQKLEIQNNCPFFIEIRWTHGQAILHSLSLFLLGKPMYDVLILPLAQKL